MSSHLRPAILVIDDDEDFRFLVRFKAEALGCEVFEASECRAGTRVLKEYQARIGVVLLDYYMPGMKPVECAEAIKVLTGSEIALVLITANVQPAQCARELGIDHWVGKPFDLQHFQRYLDLWRSRPGDLQRPVTTHYPR